MDGKCLIGLVVMVRNYSFLTITVRTDYTKGGITLDRKEKRKIRLQIIQILNEECGNCMYRKDNQFNSMCHRFCTFGKNMQQLQAKMEAKEEEKLQQAKEQPIKKFHKGRFTPEEEFYLLRHMDLYSLTHLANRLNRSLSSVSLKIKQLRRKKKEQVS